MDLDALCAQPQAEGPREKNSGAFWKHTKSGHISRYVGIEMSRQFFNVQICSCDINGPSNNRERLFRCWP